MAGRTRKTADEVVESSEIQAVKPAEAQAVEEVITEESVDTVSEDLVVSKPAEKKAVAKAEPKEEKKKITPDTQVVCKNALCNPLIYRSSSPSGAYYAWGEFGDSQIIPVSELMIMRNTQRAFFEKNWIFIDDKDVLDYLGVSRYYSSVVDVRDIDALYRKSPEDIKKNVSILSDSVRATVRTRAKELIASGKLDSVSKIKALEESLDCSLL